jgi:hypothetical protein
MPSLVLTISLLAVDQPVTLTASGAPAGAQVVFLAADSGGAGVCPASLGGVCLDLAAPVHPLGTATAGADGVAVLPFTFPAKYDHRSITFQAAARGVGPASTSALVGGTLGRDDDGDGVTTAAGDCGDGDATIHPGATEIWADGIDQDCNGLDLPLRVDEVLDDCDGAFVDPGSYPNQLAPGPDMHRIVLDDPAAICNDGSPAPIYVRAATDPAHLDDWIIHLQGGGNCVTREECEVRWCGSGVQDASKMSARWTPETFLGVGLMTADATRSDVAGYNHLYFYSCSSDHWTGQSFAVVESPGEPAFGVWRMGHAILEAGLARLEGTSAVSDDGTQVMPDLLLADQVVFTGTSAGSMGAQVHLDWVAERWAATSIRLLGVFDALVGPRYVDLDPALAATLEADQAARFAEREAQELVPEFGDESCMAAAAPEDLWRCTSPADLAYADIDTPFFVRMDLEDATSLHPLLVAGATTQELVDALAVSFGVLRARTFADGTSPGIFAPRCARHVGLEAEAYTFDQPIWDGAADISLHDAILAAMGGAPPDLVDVDGTLSTCP